MPQFAPECLIQGLNDLPSNSDLPLISKLIVGDANRNGKKRNSRLHMGNIAYLKEPIFKKCKNKTDIFTVCNYELEEIQTFMQTT